jgi:OOP family OmpA-OmpF porin
MSRSHATMMLSAMVLLVGIRLASSDGLSGDPAMESGAPVAAGSSPPTVARRIVLHGVDFDENRPSIRADATPVLDEAIRCLDNEEGMIVIVRPRAASTVSAAFSRVLGSRRAKAVRRYLVEHGIAAERMTIEDSDEPAPPTCIAATGNQIQNPCVELQID